jgi:hypothetical protein
MVKSSRKKRAGAGAAAGAAATASPNPQSDEAVEGGDDGDNDDDEPPHPGRQHVASYATVPKVFPPHTVLLQKFLDAGYNGLSPPQWDTDITPLPHYDKPKGARFVGEKNWKAIMKSLGEEMRAKQLITSHTPPPGDFVSLVRAPYSSPAISRLARDTRYPPPAPCFPHPNSSHRI